MTIYSSSTQSLMSILIITISLLMLSQNANSASFSFSRFGPNTYGLKLEGDAFLSSGAIQLSKTVYYNNNPLPNSAGRASYYAPVRLWDAKTGQLARFTTTFSFIVAPNSPNDELFGDGISFFIAPFQSKIPDNSTGGFLGLFDGETALNYYKNQIVAVEFDSFAGNPWDPDTAHIGIDVNSIASVSTAKWQTGNVLNGFTALATVSYEPRNKSLSVYVRYPGSRVDGTSSSLSYLIDLRAVLPEWVRIGFSGATGNLVEDHKIYSWSFFSSFY